MHQALTSSHIAAASAALTAANSQIIFGTSAFQTLPCDEAIFAFDCTESHCFPIDQGNIGVSRFADRASRAYSLSPLSDDDRTSAGGAGAPPPSGSDGGDDPKDPKAKLTANFVFDALKSMRDRFDVSPSDVGLMDALLEHGLIKRVEDTEREAMKEFYATLDGVEEEYERVVKAIEDREHEQAELEKSLNFIFNRLLTSFFESVNFLSPLIKKIGFLSSLINRFTERREAKLQQCGEIETEIANMTKDRRALQAKLDRRNSLGEWLDSLRCCNDKGGYVFLTVKGKLLLDRMEGDRKLEYLTFEDYMRLFSPGNGA